MIELRTLGLLDLRGSDGRELRSILAQPKRLALLLYLAAASPQRSHRRDTLLGLFWPHLDHEHARAALRQAVAFLRRSLDDDVLVGRSDEELAASEEALWCDVCAFDHACDAGSWTEALELYQGEFLEGFFVSDAAPELEQWIDDQRVRLRRRAVEAAWCLAESSRGEGDEAAAARWGHRALSLAPDDETELRRLVTLLDGLGDRAGALQVYEDFARRLARRYEVEPSAKTQTMIEALRSGAIETEAASSFEPKEATPTAALSEATAPVDLNGGATGEKTVVARRRLRIALIAVVGTMAVGAASLLMLGSGVALEKDRVLVAVFENRTGDPSLDPLGVMAADWITEGLSRTGIVEVVPSTVALLSSREVAERAAAQEGLDQVRVLAEETGAGTVVWGAYYRVGEDLGFQTQITDVAAGKLLIALEPVIASPNAPLRAVEEIRQRVMGALATVHNPRVAASFAIESAPPPKFEAYQEYAVGLDLFVSRKFEEAIDRFYRAAKIDSTFAAAQLWVSLGYWFRGQLPKVDSITRLVIRSREQLIPADREFLDYMVAAVRGDWPAALRAAQRRRELAPDPLWTYTVGMVSLWVNKPRESVEALKELDPAGPAFEGWYDYWQWLTAGYHILADHEAELEEALRARQQYPDRLATLACELQALAALGRLEELNERLDEVVTLPTQGSYTPGWVMRGTAVELRVHGNRDRATEVFERTIHWYRSRLENGVESTLLRWGLALTLYEAERWQEAHLIVQQLVEEFPGNVNYLGYLGILSARLGNTQQALQIDEELRALSQPYSLGAPSYWRARIAAVHGKRDRAVDLLRDAIANGRTYGVGLHRDKDLESLRGYPPFEQLLQQRG